MMKQYKIRIYGLIVAALLVGAVGCGNNNTNISSDRNDTTEEPSEDYSHPYSGIYYIYRNKLGKMQILVETSTSVNDDLNHRQIHFGHSSSCKSPDWSWHHYDYDFWPSVEIDDRKGIPNKEDRRLWVVTADGLTPDCFYDVTFKYRDYDPGWDNWSETWGHFYAPPLTDGFDPSKSASELEFYALGDTRVTNDNYNDLNGIFEALMGHSGKKALLLHTGDIVWNGGSPVGWYRYSDGSNNDGYGKHIHNNDSWFHTFLGQDYVPKVWEVLRHMPMFPVVGNHDIQINALNNGDYYDYYSKNFIYNFDTITNAYNYTHYFGGFSLNNLKAIEHQYWFRAYGPLLVWGLTAYPYEDPWAFCEGNNTNFLPSHEGGTGQYEWLEASLKKHAGDVRQWKVVMLHTPIFDPDGGCSNQVAAQTWLKPLFEKYGVDLVLTSHEHFYARKTVNDIPYLVIGGGGAGLSLSQKCQDDAQCNGFDLVKKKHHFGYFHIKGDMMECSIIGSRSDKFDSFVLDRTPKANFDLTPTEGIVPPLTVKFSDTSTGNRYKYKWDFGDGQTSEGTDLNASTEHIYMTEGVYTVTLTIKSATGGDTKTCTSCVYVGPIADFDATPPLEGNISLTVQFHDKSKGNILSWLWDFGDGSTSADQNPLHTYQKNGRHTVKLTVSGTNDSSNMKTRSYYIKVEPYAVYRYDVNIECARWLDPPADTKCIEWDYPTEFTNLSQGNNLTYHWDFGDGSTSNEENPSHTYSSDAGGGFIERLTKLTVTDGFGNEDSITRTIKR